MNQVHEVSSRISVRAREAGFDLSSAPALGQLLGALAASKPGGRLLELGTGVGLGTVHLLGGMSATARLVTVEQDPALSLIASDEIADPRIEFVIADGGEWLDAQLSSPGSYDLVFADTWPGKFDHLQQALALVAPGGMYVVDDLLPQPSWPAEHQPKVDNLTARLVALDGWRTVRLDDATGIMICSKLA